MGTKTPKYQAALAAIRSVFSDTSVSPSATKGMLQDLRDEIEVSIESIDADDDDE